MKIEISMDLAKMLHSLVVEAPVAARIVLPALRELELAIQAAQQPPAPDDKEPTQ